MEPYDPTESFIFGSNPGDNKSLILVDKPKQNEKERKLLDQIKDDSLSIDELHPSNQKIEFTKTYQNLEDLTMDKDLIDDITQNNQGILLTSEERNLKEDDQNKSKSDIKISTKLKKRNQFRHPARILSSSLEVSLKNAFNQKEIKSMIKRIRDKSTKKKRKLMDMDTFASPLLMAQRVPAVPNRFGHSLLMSISKMFGGKLNIKVPPQPPVIMVNQSPFYST